MKRLFLVLAVPAVACGMEPAKWISGDTLSPEKPAPMLVKEFDLEAVPREAEVTAAFAGWGEVYVNGQKAGSDVLAPVTCQPDRRHSSKTYDVTKLLRAGRNEIGLLLGNGWFNHFTITGWGFHEAPWIACPKVRAELRADGKTVLTTDGTWTACDSPIVFNSLRNGEWYDARREGKRLNARPAKLEKYAPWGCVTPEDAMPCREGELLEPQKKIPSPEGGVICDFGANIAGWCEIDVKGEAGAKVTLDYDESLTPSNTFLGHITMYVKQRGETRPVQHDEYTLAGRSEGESWHPRFTFHGFRYARVAVEGKAEVKAVRARFVHSAFPEAGRLETSDATFTALQDATRRSYLGNFVGIPTDCPHREKNGWTGDAHWLTFGDRTLREDWDDANSHNHIMFGDLSAWAYEYAAGIVPMAPGFGKVAFRPHYLKGVDAFSATHRTPHGESRASWRQVNGKIEFTYSVPEGVEVVEVRK